jgi:hypothetical protein
LGQEGEQPSGDANRLGQSGGIIAIASAKARAVFGVIHFNRLSLFGLPELIIMPIVGKCFSEMPAMSSLEEVQKANRELAQRINDEARNDPYSPYAGKFVGIVNGQVVVVADDPKSLYHRLAEIEPDHHRAFWVEAGHDPTKIEYIWGC